MDFALSDNQKNIIATFREFGESVFTPESVFQWRKDQGLPDEVVKGFVGKGAPLAVECTKRTAYETMGENVVYPSRGWEILEEIEQITQNSEDKIEGATAFAEKREPVWKGR